MRYLYLILVLSANSLLHTQPIPTGEIVAGQGHYIFTVYTPNSDGETDIWSFGHQTMTTHQIIDRQDGSSLRLPPVQQTVLRTFFTTQAVTGADAGAVQVTVAADAPPIGEILHYPALLSPEQRQLTESYLAIKYGLTLDQQRLTNYLAPAGPHPKSVWTATAEPEFRHRIIGLAQDQASQLLRQRGYAVSAPKTLNISWNTAPDTTAYLLLADNGLPTARPSGQRQLQRRWRAQTTGTVPETTLRFDTRQFFDRAQPGNVWELVVRNHDGTTLSYPATATTDARLTFSNVAFPPNAVVHLSLVTAEAAPVVSNAQFFTEVRLSPNPVRAGQEVSLRAATAEPVALTMSVYDAAGRGVTNRRLPSTTHHLARLSFPAPGTYTLHLRPRQLRRLGNNSTNGQPLPNTTLKVVVQ